MTILKTFCLLALFGFVVINGVKKFKNFPPSINNQAGTLIYFKGDNTEKEIQLPCVASGYPPPEYYWRKDGRKLLSNRTTIEDRGIGTLTIKQPTKEDVGKYRCYAKNGHGVSVSVITDLQQAVLKSFASHGEPRKVSTSVGSSLKLECNVPESNPPVGKVEWQLMDIGSSSGSKGLYNPRGRSNQVVLDDRITQDYEGNLYFTNVKADDATPDGQMYTCVATNGALRISSQGDDQIVTVSAPIQGSRLQNMAEIMWSSSEEITALKGDPLYLKCIFSGNPTPTVSWLRNHNQASQFKGIKIQDYGMELFIRNVEPEHAGRYKCTGRNSVTTTMQTRIFKVTVESSPYWLDEPKDTIKGVEETAEFMCNAKGVPEVKTQWFIDGSPVEDHSQYPRHMVYGRKLIIKNLTKEDSKVIQCNASNIHGYLWADVYLNVLAEKPEIFGKEEQPIKVAEGKQLRLPCNASGRPYPKITWKKGNQNLLGGVYQIAKDGTLINEKVVMADKGDYKCLAKNRFGYDEKSVKVLVVKPTRIVSKTPDGYKKAGTAVTLKCSTVTDPDETKNLRISWSYYGMTLKDHTSKHHVNQNMLTLTIYDAKAEDTGMYTCNVSNGIDSAQATIKITVKDKPDPPTDVRFLSCVNHFAVVAWKNGSDQNSPITRYVIQYRADFFEADEWAKAAEAVPEANNATVELFPWANFTFRVIAVNDIGESLPSRASHVCESAAAIPVLQPKNVNTPTNKKKYLVVKWDETPRKDHYGPKYHYRVTIEKDNKKQQYNVTDYTKPYLAIPVETVYEPYDVTVESVNERGVCKKEPAKKIVGYSGEAEPNLVPGDFRLDPRTNVTATSAAFLWTAVDHKSPQLFGKFAGYRIQFWKQGRKAETIEEVDVPEDGGTRRKRAVQETIRHSVRSLPPFSKITLQVAVANTHYTGPPSNQVHLETPEGTPGKVAFLAARIKGANHFVLNWGPPVNPNGIITGYELQYNQVTKRELGQASSVITINDPDRRYYILDRLLNEQNYRITIWATTRIGSGKKYYIDVVTGTGHPSTPHFLFQDVKETSFNVTWHKFAETAPSMGYHHYVQYRKAGDQNWLESKRESTNLWTLIENLSPGTEYEVVVIATTLSGNYPSESEHQFVFTPSAEHVRHAVAGAHWFIGLMVTIAVLLLILVIICIVKRNRGDKYLVQEKERLQGANLENGDNVDFNPYMDYNDDNSIGKKSGGSRNDPDNQGSEVDSMEEYAGVDPSKFNEDGSFIGQYGDKSHSGNERPPMSTFM